MVRNLMFTKLILVNKHCTRTFFTTKRSVENCILHARYKYLVSLLDFRMIVLSEYVAILCLQR